MASGRVLASFKQMRLLPCRWSGSRLCTVSGPLSRGLPAERSSAVTTTSSLLISTRRLPDKDTVPSLKLMLQGGLIRFAGSGLYHLLPLGLRAMEKIIALIDKEMQTIGAVKMSMPILTPASLWKISGRWDEVGSELFRLQDHAGTDYLMGPTHEEPITDLVRQEVQSYKQLPLRLYQIDHKFRDERRPRCGLLRAREFLMKDLYTFDINMESATTTYHDVCCAYERLFSRLKLPVTKVKASSGNIGGSLSHEYQVLADIGEDTIIRCTRCGCGSSAELQRETQSESMPGCPHNGVDCKLEENRGIEVAHSFLLGTKYSSAFKASFSDVRSNNQKFFEMGCYGIGVSRLLQTTIEHNCRDDERIRWPHSIAPYHVCIVPLTNSRDDTDSTFTRALDLYHTLMEDVGGGVFCGEVVLDDRTHLSHGSRLRQLSLLGFPVSVIIGKKTPIGMYQVEMVMETGNRKELTMDKDTLVQHLKTSMMKSPN